MSKPLLEATPSSADRSAGPNEAPAQIGYDLAACRALMRGGSKSFFAASLMLPARVRAPASALYAYCRLADDAIDLGSDPFAAMATLRGKLDAVYDGRPGPDVEDRALCQVVHRFTIPRVLLDALLEGFLWDAQGRRYQTLADVQDYGARVAGAVGAKSAHRMERHQAAVTIGGQVVRGLSTDQLLQQCRRRHGQCCVWADVREKKLCAKVEFAQCIAYDPFPQRLVSVSTWCTRCCG